MQEGLGFEPHLSFLTQLCFSPPTYFILKLNIGVSPVDRASYQFRLYRQVIVDC